MRARRSAVFGVVAFLQVPLVHFSVIWWRTLHQPPTVLRPGDPTIDHTMLAALLVNLLAFTLLHLMFVRAEARLAEARDRIDAAAEDRPTVAGDAVTAPRMEESDV